MVELAIDAAGESDVDIAVQHLAAQERAEALLAQLRAELGPRLGDSFLAEVGAVIGAHTGPGCIGVTVHRHPASAFLIDEMPVRGYPQSTGLTRRVAAARRSF
jgi:hypothetical protein